MANLLSLVTYVIKLQGKRIIFIPTQSTTTFHLYVIQPISPTFCSSITFRSTHYRVPNKTKNINAKIIVKGLPPVCVSKPQIPIKQIKNPISNTLLYVHLSERLSYHATR